MEVQNQEAPASGGTTNGRALAFDRAALVAELEKIPRTDVAPIDDAGEAPAAAEAEQSEEAPPPAKEAPEDESEEAEAEKPSDETDTQDEDIDEDGELSAAVKGDGDLKKRIALLQKAEKRQKEIAAKERAAFERERAEFSERAQKLADYEAKLQQYMDAQARVQYDPVSVLTSLGLEGDALEYAAKQAYAASKAGSADPKVKDAAAATMRERALMTRLEKLEKANQELATRWETQQKQAEQEREVSKFLDSVAKEVSDETPLVASWNAKSPEKVRGKFHEVAGALLRETGEVPSAKQVVRALEKMRREELEELGLDVGSVLKSKTKHQNPVAGEKQAAKTLGSGLGTTTTPRSTPKTRDELKREISRALETGEGLE